jgi:hypothetical protein
MVQVGACQRVSWAWLIFPPAVNDEMINQVGRSNLEAVYRMSTITSTKYWTIRIALCFAEKEKSHDK